MADIYNDPKYACPPPSLPPHDDLYSRTVYQAIQQDADFNSCSSMLDVVYKKLEDIHIHEKTSNLSPAAMAIIAIAVSVAMGPGGASWIGSGATNAIGGAAMQAGAVTLATSAATSLANGEGIDGVIKKITSSDGLRSLAISMATAGVLNSEAFKSLGFVNNADFASNFFTSELAIDIATQATQAVVTSTVRAGISTIINGGDLGDFGDSFKTSLIQSGVNALGEAMTDKISDAFSLESGESFDVAMTYISNAAAGCIIGAVSFETQDNGQQDSNDSAKNNCASAATGAVIGTAVAHATLNSDEFKQESEALETKIVALDFDENKHGKILDFIKSEDFKHHALGELHSLRDEGADIAKLSAALGVFVAGGSSQQINLSANLSEDVAKTQIQTQIQFQMAQAALSIENFNQQPDDYFANLDTEAGYDKFTEYFNAKIDNENTQLGKRTLEGAKKAATLKLKLYEPNATDQQITEIVNSQGFEDMYNKSEEVMELIRLRLTNFKQIGAVHYQTVLSTGASSDEGIAILGRKMREEPVLTALIFQDAQPVLQPLGKMSKDIAEQLDNPIAKWTLIAF
jgi:hypothetical protein